MFESCQAGLTPHHPPFTTVRSYLNSHSGGFSDNGGMPIVLDAGRVRGSCSICKTVRKETPLDAH
jgi:hypothetical protein